MSRAVITGALLVLAAGAAFAQQGETVKSLLAQGFTTVGAITSPVGAGVFLQNKSRLFLCFVSEAPRSATVATKYCKPVE